MNRRTFLRNVGVLTAGAMLPRVWWPVAARATTDPQILADRILVMIVLEGGNDGLNTLIPRTDPLYTALRPTLAVPAQSVLGLTADTGLHPSLGPLMPLWNEGRMAAVRDVSYPDANLSHFRATDILFSGSDSHEVIATGWLARWLEALHPEIPGVLPPDPLALQQGLSAGLLTQGNRGSTGVVVHNPSSFYWLVNSNWTGLAGDVPPATRGGAELGYLREIDRASFEYANSIQTAAQAGANAVAYPDTWLAEQLAVTARLISGGMNTPVYVTAQRGYDTHAGQPGDHPALLAELAGAIAAFTNDLKAMGRWQDTLIVTMSEFGRRPEENGSDGTDHGTAAPWMLFGGGVQGGLIGGAPNLSTFDENGNLLMQHDYRSVYASVLENWFGTAPATVQQVLGGAYSTFGFTTALSARGGDAPVRGLSLRVLGANPSHGPRRIAFTLPEAGWATVRVYDVRGRRVAELVNARLDAGAHEARWDASGAARGVYFARVSAGGSEVTGKVVIG